MFLRLMTVIMLSIALSLPSYANTIQSYLSDAAQSQSQGDFKTTLIHLKNASQKAPDNIKVKLALADLFIQIGFGPQAAIELDKAEFLGAKKESTQLLRIKSQLIQGKFVEVTSQISEILNVNTKDIGRIRALQGQAYLNQGNIEKARSYFLRGSRLAPKALEVKVGLARLYSIDKRNNEAKTIIESLYQQYPYNSNVLLLVGNLYREEHKYNQARHIFEKTIEIQPGNTAARIGMISSFIGEGLFQEADKAVAELLSVDAEHETGNHLQAVIAYQLKNYTKALQAIKVVEKNNRNHKGILLVSGSVYFQQGKLDAAETNLTQYLAFKPNDLGARKILSAVYLKRKQASQVIKLLKPYDNENDVSTLSLLSSAYKMIGNEKKSTEYLEKALKLDPDNKVMLTQQRLNHVLSNTKANITLVDDNYEDFNGIGLAKVLQLLKNKKPDKAIQLIQVYQAKEPKNYVFYNLLGQSYLQKKELNQAKISYNKVLELNSHYQQARISLARIALAQRDLKTAKREYQRVLSKDPDNEMAMLDLAKLSRGEKNYGEMLTWLNKARRASKSSLTPRLMLNQYYLSKGEFKDALTVTNELIEIQPENINILKIHADNLLKSNNLSQAIRIYKKIVSLEPDAAQTYYWLASAQYLWDDFDNARKNFAKVLSIKPDHIISRNAIIKLELSSKQYNKALFQAGELIKINPKAPLSHETMGDILMLLRRPQEAIESYKTALLLHKNNYLLVDKIARAYAVMGNLEMAAKTFESWLNSYPENTKLRMMLALLYQQTQQLDKAKSHYEKVIELKPDNVSAINNLALIYFSLNDQKSLEYAEIAYTLAPENPNVLDTLGWLLLQSGEPGRALKLLREAVAVNPSDFDLRYHYAVALTKNKLNKEAKVQLNMIVPVPGNFKARAEAKALLERL